MAASEYAYPSNDPEGHPATQNIERGGLLIPDRVNAELGRTAQLSEIAHGEGDESVRQFTIPERDEESHDYGPDH